MRHFFPLSLQTYIKFGFKLGSERIVILDVIEAEIIKTW